MVRNEGALSLYRGVVAPLLGNMVRHCCAALAQFKQSCTAAVCCTLLAAML